MHWPLLCTHNPLPTNNQSNDAGWILAQLFEPPGGVLAGTLGPTHSGATPGLCSLQSEAGEPGVCAPPASPRHGQPLLQGLPPLGG